MAATLPHPLPLVCVQFLFEFRNVLRSDHHPFLLDFVLNITKKRLTYIRRVRGTSASNKSITRRFIRIVTSHEKDESGSSEK